MKIPRIIHQIWLGPDVGAVCGNPPMPSVMEAWSYRWRIFNPYWQLWMWTEVSIGGVLHLFLSHNRLSCGPPVIRPLPSEVDLLRRACHISQRSNIWRYLIVQQFGGLYVDTDVEPCRPIEEIVAPHEAFAAVRTGSHPLTIAESGLFGAVANHPWICDVVKNLHHKDPTRSLSMGVELLTEVTRRHNEVAYLPTDSVVFDPPADWQVAKKEARVPRHDEGARRYPNASAVHHWSSLWHKDGFVERG